MRDLLHDAVNLARDLARGLSPVDKDEGGLASALEELVTRVGRLSGVSCEFHAKGSLDLLDNNAAVHIYRIAQEAVTNAIKHSMATSILVSLATNVESVRLEVEDNGTGFDSSAPLTAGMGLNIMRYRAGALHGTLEIRPAIPQGTVVSCVATAPQAGEDRL